MKKTITLALVLIASVLLLSAAQKPVALRYTKDAQLTLPDYRKWVFLGTGLGMNYSGDAVKTPPFTTVFVEPWAYDAFMKNGMWPDKTLLIAEMRGSDTGVSINKNGFVQTQKLIDIEAEVKDAAKGGWAFYGFPNGAQTGKLFPKSIPCYSCHQEHAATDNTFVQFYPTLIETAKQQGTFKADR